MEAIIEKYKGIHPGMVLERELKKRNLKKAPFALSLPEYPQTLNEITKGKRGINAALALKLDRALGLEEGTMFILQAYYEIKKEQLKNELNTGPDLSLIRKILFWDTDINKINWLTQYKSVIKRVFERGNFDEKEEIVRFYGKEKVAAIIGNTNFSESLLIMNDKNTR